MNLGEGAIIGMGSVVTKNVPAFETWIGCPAHKIEKNIVWDDAFPERAEWTPNGIGRKHERME